MLRTRLARTWDWIRSRRLVGEDEHHLFYSEFVAKGKPERRYVEYKDRDITQSSDRMPIEWWSWLHNRRDLQPTDEEIARSERRQRTLADRVAILEAEDEKQRLRQYAGSNQDPASAERRAARRRNVLESLAKAASSTQQTTEGITLASTVDVKKSREGFSECNAKEDPQGAGEDFQPGSWNPQPSRRRRQGP